MTNTIELINAAIIVTNHETGNEVSPILHTMVRAIAHRTIVDHKGLDVPQDIVLSIYELLISTHHPSYMVDRLQKLKTLLRDN
jgi:hypothetical protein